MLSSPSHPHVTINWEREPGHILLCIKFHQSSVVIISYDVIGKANKCCIELKPNLNEKQIANFVLDSLPTEIGSPKYRIITNFGISPRQSYEFKDMLAPIEKVFEHALIIKHTGLLKDD